MVKKIQTHCLVIIYVYPVEFNGIPCESETCEGFYNDWTVTDVINVMRMYSIVSQTQQGREEKKQRFMIVLYKRDSLRNIQNIVAHFDHLTEGAVKVKGDTRRVR